MKHRGIAMGTKGMVASAHSLISSSGIKVLHNGGNAMDAAVAMALTSGVVLPDMCSLGGDVFFLYYDAKSKKVYALNGSGACSMKASRELFDSVNYSEGIYSITMPGEPDSLNMALKRFGSMKMKDLVQDAVELAEKGCPISEKVARHIRTDYQKVANNDDLAQMFLNNDGTPKDAGELYTNKKYAEVLKYYGEHPDEFYDEYGDEIEAYTNGYLTKEELKATKAEWKEPISIDYRGYQIVQLPPVSQGIIQLEMMKIIEQFDMASLGYETAESIHVMVEAKKLAFNDRKRLFGDPACVTNPIEEILSEEHIKKCASLIKQDKVLPVHDEIPYDEFGHTTSFSVVDKEGNAVSFIHSVAGVWGSGVMIHGIVMNNRCYGFNTTEGHPNCVYPGKKPMHTLVAYLVLKDNELVYVGNTPGGDNQPQWNTQNLINVIDYKLDVQSALEHAKWTHTGTNLKIESQIGEDVLNKLQEKGHVLQIIEPFTCSGGSELIEIRKNGVRYGASDPRCDGNALPE